MDASKLTLSQQTLPPPLMTSEVGSFAQNTIIERKPEIIRRVIADNAYPPDILEALQGFVLEIASKPITPLQEITEDSALWNAQVAQYRGRTWLEMPWYFAETYFYRRLLEIVGYMRPGPTYELDPFKPQKITLENSAIDQLQANWQGIKDTPILDRFDDLLHAALWGNRADLSNFTVKETAQQGSITHSLRQHIIIDHTQSVRTTLAAGAGYVMFINDNVGADSLWDLLLADFLLTQHWVQNIVFHLKNRPFFVSDAMPVDILRVIENLCARPEPLASVGNRLRQWLLSGRLQLAADPFWTSFMTFHQLTAPVYAALSEADLIILKGDVNYRRLLDDRHWQPMTIVETITAQFPKPFLIIRTLKGEIIAGLAEGQAEEIAAEDPTWLINGKRGLIQFVEN